MGNVRAKIQNFRFKGILAIVVVFALITLILLVELMGVQVNYMGRSLECLAMENIVTKDAALQGTDKDTMLLYSSKDKASSLALEQFEVILKDMKVGTEMVDLAYMDIPDYSGFSTIIILFGDLSHVGREIADICDWVYEGGNVLFPLTLEQNPYSASVENKIGIIESSDYTHLQDMYIEEGFMVGGGRSFAVADGYDSARTVRLTDDAKVYVYEGEQGGVPLIWERSYGKGKFVVDNFGMCDKAYRGFFAASMSLFDEVYLYPVINGSAFYLDDFPSQIPEGTNDYISRDYNTTVRDFYINIWWPDMMNIADKYGIKYTGLAIECYDDAVDGTTDATPDTGTFLNFGNMLLRKGGEIGYHGYNHQPLCLSDKDYKDIYDYKTWESKEAMMKGFSHLMEFCEELFPDVEISVYVPPSNLLSEDGRDMLIEEFDIQTLSGIYLPDDVLDFCLLQEFEVDENGVVDQPRIISGCDVDDFMTMGAFSELNLHYINNHFTHPDDALDPDRGAELGWDELYKRFDVFLGWLYGSAPELRNLTSTEFSGAVQRFAAVIPHVEKNQDNMVLTIENFHDQAFFMARFNEKKPAHIKGGKLTHITGNLYLIEAGQEIVTVTYE